MTNTEPTALKRFLNDAGALDIAAAAARERAAHLRITADKEEAEAALAEEEARTFRKWARSIRASGPDTSAEPYDHDPLLQFFEYFDLPRDLQDVAKPFHQLAWQVHNELPRNPERTVALRLLLQSKDAAVRAKIYR